MSYNIHGLLHLVEDVSRFGPLDSHSAFSYENNMMYFQKLCRKPHLQLEQIARRRTEEDIIARRNIPVNEIDTSIKTWGKHKVDPLALYDIPCLTNYYQYRSVKTSEFFLDQSQRDNCCILYDLRVCNVVKILSNNKDYYLVVKVFNSVCDFYDIGINSSSVDLNVLNPLMNASQFPSKMSKQNVLKCLWETKSFLKIWIQVKLR